VFKKHKSSSLILVVIPILVSIALYFQVLNGFFQQDEWKGYADYVLLRNVPISVILKTYLLPASGLTHYMPINFLVVHYLFTLIGLNYTYFAVLSLVLNCVVVFFIYLFFTELTSSKIKSLLATLLFVFLSSGFQGTAWAVADLGTHLAFITALVSMIYFLKFIKKHDNKYQIICSLFLIISLLCKEIGLGLIILYVVYYMFVTKGNLINKIKDLKIIFLPFLVYLLFRMVFAFFVKQSVFYSSSGIQMDMPRFIYNLVTLPIKAFIQALVPSELLFKISMFLTRLLPEKITGVFGSPQFEMFAVKRVLELIVLLLSIMFIGLVILNVKKIRNLKYRREVIFGGLFVILSTLVISFAPERSGIVSFIDSRYLYFINFGVVIILSSSITRLPKKLGFFLVILISITNAFYLYKNILQFKANGQQRVYILNTIVDHYPQLPKKTVFYIESDRSYYGLSENEKILPFQSGFGQTLLAWYSQKDNFPVGFFTDRFLWDIATQDYKEYGDRGFGYFRDRKLLGKIVVEYKIPLSSVIAFSWDGTEGVLRDITPALRKELRNEIY
jgi:hypothetical protein